MVRNTLQKAHHPIPPIDVDTLVDPALASFKGAQNVHGDDEVYWRKDGTSFPVEFGLTSSLAKVRP
jgi:hypothetical protein